MTDGTRRVEIATNLFIERLAEIAVVHCGKPAAALHMDAALAGGLSAASDLVTRYACAIAANAEPSRAAHVMKEAELLAHHDSMCRAKAAPDWMSVNARRTDASVREARISAARDAVIEAARVLAAATTDEGGTIEPGTMGPAELRAVGDAEEAIRAAVRALDEAEAAK